MTPRFAVDVALADGRLVQLLPDWSLPDHAVYALFPGGAYVPAKTRLFLDRLVEQRHRLSDAPGDV